MKQIGSYLDLCLHKLVDRKYYSATLDRTVLIHMYLMNCLTCDNRKEIFVWMLLMRGGGMEGKTSEANRSKFSQQQRSYIVRHTIGQY